MAVTLNSAATGTGTGNGSGTTARLVQLAGNYTLVAGDDGTTFWAAETTTYVVTIPLGLSPAPECIFSSPTVGSITLHPTGGTVIGGATADIVVTAVDNPAGCGLIPVYSQTDVYATTGQAPVSSVTAASVNTFTNKTYDTAGTGNVFKVNGVGVTANSGTGALVRVTSAALVTPDLGTPSAVVLTSATGLPVATGISGLGTGVATFLATPSSSNLIAAVTDETGTGSLVFATSPTLVTPILGTPTSGTLTNCTLPVGGVTGLGTGVATFLATPSSANLAAALTDETGSGAAVFATSPTLVTPILGTPTSGNLGNCTNIPGTQITGLGTGVSTFLGTPTSANLAACVTNETGSGLLVFGTSPTLITPVLGTPSSGELSSCTVNTFAPGYLEIPQNSKSAGYTTVLSDSGKHIFHPAADTTARNFTIDSNANVAYPLGTVLTFINQNAGGTISIFITTDTMRLAGAGTTGTRTLAANGIATAVKITTTEWIISGTGLT